MKHRLQVRQSLAIFAVIACFIIPQLGWGQTYHTLSGGSFSQNWTNTGMITAANIWTGVPSIIGYGGNDITATTGVDPQTLLGEGTITVNVQANQTNPNTNTTGGLSEFEITNPVVAFQGSNSSDAPNIIIFLNTTGVTSIQVQYNLRDIDGSADNAIQPVALQYRIGTTGNFTNISSGFVADASSGPSLATLVTAVNVTLPAATENQAQLQLRIITSNAVGSDEWIGIDDIVISGTTGGMTAPTLVADVTNNDVDNNIDITFTNDPDWLGLVTAVKIGGTALTATTDYILTVGNLHLIPSGGNTLLTISGSKSVTIEATGYANASVTQVINAGAPTSNSTASISAALALGATRTITCTAKDQYNNLVSGYTFKYDATITNNNATTAESYTVDASALTATTNDVSVVATTNASGVATFTAALPAVIDGNDGISIQVQLNNGTTNIGSPFSFTQPLTPSISIVGTVTSFGNQTINTTSAEKSYSVIGSSLTDNIIITPPVGFEISTTTGTGFIANPATISLTPVSNAVNATIYVRFAPTLVQAYTGNITHTSTGATQQDVSVSGTGTAPLPFPLYENFDYTAATLLTANGWTAHSAGINPITVSSDPAMIYPGYLSSGIGNIVSLASTAEDDNRTFAPQTSGTVYASFLVNVSAVTTTGDYFFHLGQTTIGTTFRGRVFVKKDASNKLAFGIAQSTTVPNYTAFSYDLLTTYLVVLKYNIVSGALNDVASIYINPALNASEPASGWIANTDASSTDLTEVGSVALRQGNATNGPVLKLDGIRISTSWTDIVGLPAAPATQASAIVFSAVTGTSFTATWTNGSGASRAVFVKQATTGTAAPADNTTYPANTAFGTVGTEIGTSGWFCVYNGTGNSVSITNLTATTDYIVHVCEYNGVPGSELYNSAAATTGNPATQTTGASLSPPIVTSPTATSITTTTATLGGNITSDGGDAITSRGTVWSITEPVTITDNPEAEGGASTGVFTHPRTGLPPGTLIYYAAYATNSTGTTLSAPSTFTTLLSEPQNQPASFAATAPGATSITVTWADNNGVPPATGFLILGNKTGTFTDPPDFTDPTDDAALVDGEGVMHRMPGVETYTWTGLDPATQYFFKIYPYTNSGANIDFKTDGAPAANATTPAEVVPVVAWQFGNPASLGTEVTYNATTNNSNLNTSVLSRGAGIAPTALGRAFGANQWDNAGTKESAVTNNEYFQFTINAINGYKVSLSTLDATIRRSGTTAPNTYIWKYSTDGTTFFDIGTDVSYTGTTEGVAQPQIDLTGIAALQDVTFATTLTFRMYAWGGTSTSATYSIGRYPVDITTNSLAISGMVTPAGNTAPFLTTQAATAILSTTATGNGTITYTGGENPTVRGFCWDLAANADPDIFDSKVEETGSFIAESFTGSLTGLLPGTQYKVRPFATNSYGTGYGSAVTFYTLSGEPTSHATSFTASATSQTQIDLTFSAASTITNGAGYLILQKTGSTPTGLPVDATGYTAGNTLGDGTVAAIINSTSATTTTITGLTAGTHYYFTIFPYNWDGANAITYNYKTDATVPTADATTNPALDATSEVSGPGLASQPDPMLLSSLITTDPLAVHVFDMDIYDNGLSDAVPTYITQVTIKPGSNNSANWLNTIQGVKLSLDGGSSFVTIGTPAITVASIVIPITSGDLIIPNGDVQTLSMLVYLKSSGITDNVILEFKVDATADSHGFTADPTGSTFMPTFADAPVSNQILIDVEATKLKFIVQPTAVYLDATMSPAVTIEATDANNNRDLDKTGSVALASSGTMTGPVTATLAAGLGTFGNIVHTATGTGLALTATYAGLTDAVSNTFNVTLTAILTELVIPKYIGGRTASSTNNARTPIAVCLNIDNLLPNTVYDIRPGLALASDASTTYGAGVWWNGTDFVATTITGVFTTNASGSSGPFWLYVEPSANNTGGRFLPGTIHNLRIGYAVTGGSIPNAPNFVSAKTFTCLDLGTTALTPATTDDGAFIKGSADPTTTGKHVLLFDNVDGTGDPLYSYQIRTAAATSASTFLGELPTVISDIYRQLGTSAIGDYPAVIPIGANNPNGVQRIEARNADNTISGYNTDADGVWPSGVNTTTLARRDVGTVTVTDAPLVPVTTKTLNVTVFLEGFYTGSGMMNAAKNAPSTPEFGATIADRVTVELHDGTTPFAVAYTFNNVNLNTDGTLSIPTVPSGAGESYYIVIKHRSSVEVWSAAPVSFAGSTITYNFSDAANKAYGSALKSLAGGVFGMYSGDVTQDGVVDAADLVAVDNDAANFVTGYVTNDVNGDGQVNLDDITLLDANANAFIAKQTP